MAEVEAEQRKAQLEHARTTVKKAFTADYSTRTGIASETIADDSEGDEDEDLTR